MKLSDAKNTSYFPLITLDSSMLLLYSVKSTEKPACSNPVSYTHLEQFTGLEGRYVTLEDTISGFEALLGGELDQYPEAAFSMVGTVDEVHKKAKDMGAL